MTEYGQSHVVVTHLSAFWQPASTRNGKGVEEVFASPVGVRRSLFSGGCHCPLGVHYSSDWMSGSNDRWEAAVRGKYVLRANALVERRDDTVLLADGGRCPALVRADTPMDKLMVKVETLSAMVVTLVDKLSAMGVCAARPHALYVGDSQQRLFDLTLASVINSNGGLVVRSPSGELKTLQVEPPARPGGKMSAVGAAEGLVHAWCVRSSGSPRFFRSNRFFRSDALLPRSDNMVGIPECNRPSTGAFQPLPVDAALDVLSSMCPCRADHTWNKFYR